MSKLVLAITLAAAAALKPRDRADALNSRGVVLEGLGRPVDARECYDRALDAVAAVWAQP